MKKIVTFCSIAVAVTMASAQPPVEIGRLKVVLAEANWQHFPAAPMDVPLNGAAGSIPGEAGLLVLRRSDGRVAAAMVVGGTWGWKGRVRSINSCKPAANVYVQDFSGGREEIQECATAGGGLYLTEPMLKSSFPRLREALGTVDVKLPEASYVSKVFMINGRGSTVTIEALFAPDFTGLLGPTPLSIVPEKLPPAVAAWVDALGAASKDALNSLSGELKVPPLAFAAKPLSN